MSSTKKTHRVRADSGAGSGNEGDWWEDVKNQQLDASRETTNNKQKQQIETLKTEVSKLTNDNSKLKAEKDKLTADVKSFKVKSAEQKAHFEGLQNEIETLKDGNKTKDKKIDALEKELTALKKKLKELEKDKEEMEEKIEDLEDQNEKLIQENNDRGVALEKLQTGTFPPSPKSTESRLSRPTMSGALPPNTPTPVRSKSKAGRTKKEETKEERRERKAREARREEEEAQRRLRGRFEQRSSDDDDRSQGSTDRHRDTRDHRSKHRPTGPQDSSVYAEAWPATSTQPQYTPQSPTYPTNVPRFPAPYDPNYAPPLTQVAAMAAPPTKYYPTRPSRGGR